MEASLDEWEFLDFVPDNGKCFFSKDFRCHPREVMNINYFTCPPHEQKKNQRSPPLSQNSAVTENFDEKAPLCSKNIGASDALFKSLSGDEPKVRKAAVAYNEKESTKKPELVRDEEVHVYKEATLAKSYGFKEEELKKDEDSAEEMKEKNWWEGIGERIWDWRLNCSIGIAAATVCVFLLGSRQSPQRYRNPKLQFNICTDDKRIKQMMQQASRLNQAMAAVRNGPMMGANISFGGYYDGL